MRIYSVLLIFILFTQACGEFKRQARGRLGEIVVVMDSTKLNSKSADAVREVFGAYMNTLPVGEPIYDLNFYSIKKPSDVDFLKKQKNLIFVSTTKEETNTGKVVRAFLSPELIDRAENGQNFAYPVEDKWALNQYALFLVGPTDAQLAASIMSSGPSLVKRLDEIERDRWIYDMFEKGEQTALADSLYNQYGFAIRLQHDYEWGVDTLNFVSFRRYLPENYRWFWIHWIDGVNDVSHVDADWINAKRDSLLKQFVQGTRSDTSFTQTEYRNRLTTENITLAGRYAFETRGTWRMVGDYLGGPFVNYTVYDEDQRRLYLMEFALFAPKFDKIRFMKQFEAMAHTFYTNPDINKKKKN